MYYFNKTIDKKLLSKLLNISLSLRGVRIVFWKYEDIKKNEAPMDELDQFLLGKDKFEPLTKYYNDRKRTRNMNCYRFNKALIKILIKRFHVLVANIESVSVYREDCQKWVLGCIFHEKMTLFKISEEEVRILKKNHVSYSDSAPDWW
jgi:hypothetical protein